VRMEDATSGRSRKTASEDNVTTCTILYEDNITSCTILYEDNITTCTILYEDNIKTCTILYEDNITTCTILYEDNITTCTILYEDNITTCTILYEDNITTCTILYEVAASVKDAKKMAVSRLSLDARARIRFQVSPCKIFGRKSFTGTGFSPGTSIFHYQFYSTNSLNLFPFTSCSYQKEK